MNCEQDAGSVAPVPVAYAERAVYVVKGRVELAGTSLGEGQMAVLRRSTEPTPRAQEDAIVMLLGGEPLGERFNEWNFVPSFWERISMPRLIGAQDG